VCLFKEVGVGFYYLKFDFLDVLNRILSLSLYKLSIAIDLIQKWSHGFNPIQPVGFFTPVWIALRYLSFEYMSSTWRVASMIGMVIEEDTTMSVLEDPKFCMAMDVEQGWTSK
jgi:hypothetical protein